MSFVADHTFYRGVSEPDVAKRIAPLSVLINVHCRCADAVARFERRMRADPLCGEQRLRKLLPLATRLQEGFREPLALSCPTFVVDTDDGYAPSLEAIVGAIDARYHRPEEHDLDRQDGRTEDQPAV